MSRETKGKLLVITCECGFQIPVVSDAEAVGNVIDAHVAEHRSKKVDPAKADKEAEHIQNYLFSELFRKIGKITF